MTATASSFVASSPKPLSPPETFTQEPRRNLLLAGLSPEASSIVHKHLREHEFRSGTLLWGAGEYASHVCFPVSGMISIRVCTGDGHGIEVATIGHEGCVGFHDRSSAPRPVTQAAIQVSGRFVTIPTPSFAAAVQQNEEIRLLAAASHDWLLLQSQQIAACNAVHPADARLCRWLLRTSEAIGQDIIPVTQEEIAQALGIRRTTATLIAQQIQSQGVIRYSRGKIAIVDRAALKSMGCGCCSALDRAHWPSELFQTHEA